MAKTLVTRLLAPGLILAGLLLLATGCTSDDPSAVGSGQQDLSFDLVVQPLKADQTDGFAALEIQDEKIPVSQQQVMYLGFQGGTSSSILVNFSFDDLYSDEFPEEIFTAENIKSVKLSLVKLDFYGNGGNFPSGEPPSFYYTFKELDAPFDTTAVPGPVPPASPVELIRNPRDFADGKEPNIPLFESDFLGWLAEGGQRRFVLSADVGSDAALVGFCGREFLRYNELADLGVGTIVAPNLQVEFNEGVVLADTTAVLLIPPYADSSTFDEIGEAPAEPGDGFIVRTGLRSYPAFRFDFSGLPANAFINRAVLSVTNDTLTSYGNRHSLVVCELPVEAFTEPADTLSLTDLGDQVYVITGQTSLEPATDRDIRFNVTQAVQRLANGVYEGERALVITAGEDFAPLYDQGTIDPEFYYSQFNFMGFAAPDTLDRPHLEITYSLSGLVGEGSK